METQEAQVRVCARAGLAPKGSWVPSAMGCPLKGRWLAPTFCVSCPCDKMRQDPCLGCVRGLVVRMEFKIRERKNVCDPLPVSCQPLCPQPEQCTLWNMKNRILYCKARLCGCRRDRGTGVQGSTWSNLSVCGWKFCSRRWQVLQGPSISRWFYYNLPKIFILLEKHIHVVQWLRFHAPNVRGPGSIPGQETKSHLLQLKRKKKNPSTATWNS